jgi:hypothetical protein
VGVSEDQLRADWTRWLAHFHETTGHTHVEGSQEAKRSFAARRNAGRSVEELMEATVGCHGNDRLRDQGFDRPETILRGSKFERYIGLARQANGDEPIDFSGFDGEESDRREEVLAERRELGEGPDWSAIEVLFGLVGDGTLNTVGELEARGELRAGEADHLAWLVLVDRETGRPTERLKQVAAVWGAR